MCFNAGWFELNDILTTFASELPWELRHRGFATL